MQFALALPLSTDRMVLAESGETQVKHHVLY